MSTVPVTPAPKKSFLQKLGSDFKAVFSWLGSPKGQATVLAGEALGESIADVINPALVGLNPVINSWTQEIFKAESLAAAAGSQDGSGTQKAAMVLGAVVPQVDQFASANGLSAPAAADVTAFNTALVTFLNAFGANAAPASS